MIYDCSSTRNIFITIGYLVSYMHEKPDSTIQSVDISCRIVETLEELGRVGVSELAEELGHSKSTIHDHLTTLQANQFVFREDDGYRLSLRFVKLSQSVKDQQSNYSIIQEAVDELAEETGEQAQFGSEDYGTLIYLYRTRGESDISRRFRPEVEEPLHCTALGKAMLAFMSQERIDRIVDYHGLEQRTPNTLTDYDELMDELDQIRDQKFAVDDEELANGMRCVAAPVTRNNTVVGAIGVSGPVSRLDDERLTGELAVNVRRVANVIEINSMFSEQQRK